MKKVLIDIAWGVAVVVFWLYQVFWGLLWTPLIGKANGEKVLYLIDAIVLAIAIVVTVKGYGRRTVKQDS
ncbi:hypothetical protein [Schleiferilactobacillus shenzhenensis]|nr:hypothetical protein [Schleiferilactobacillus shenzhenensis]